MAGKYLVISKEHITSLKRLSPEELYFLLFALNEYDETGKEPEFDDQNRGIVIWDILKNQNDSYRAGYEHICAVNRENGKKGGRKRKNETQDKPNGTEKPFTEQKEVEKNRTKPTKTEKNRSVFVESEKTLLDIERDKDIDKDIDRERKKEREKEMGNSESMGSMVSPPTLKMARGCWNNIFLTQDEYNHLLQTYPHECRQKIDRLSQYKYESGKKYEHDAAVIERWILEDRAKLQKENGERTYDLQEMERLSEEVFQKECELAFATSS